MPVMPEFNEAIYYLTKKGELLFRSVPMHESLFHPDGDVFVRSWKFVEIGQDPKTFLEFLKEAKALGAKDEEIIRLINDSGLGEKLKNVNLLGVLGMSGEKRIGNRRVITLNKVKV